MVRTILFELSGHSLYKLMSDHDSQGGKERRSEHQSTYHSLFPAEGPGSKPFDGTIIGTTPSPHWAVLPSVKLISVLSHLVRQMLKQSDNVCDGL